MVAARIANLPEGRPDKTPPIGGVSQDAAAEMLNVGTRSVQRAKKVLDDGLSNLLLRMAGEPEIEDALVAGERGACLIMSIYGAPPLNKNADFHTFWHCLCGSCWNP
jgi:hypothetical protein